LGEIGLLWLLPKILLVWDMNKIFEYREEVLLALQNEIISKDEAREYLIRGFGKLEVPLFFDFEESNPLKRYDMGLEKIGIIKPLIRLDGFF
jgi:hypothetical protein